MKFNERLRRERIEKDKKFIYDEMEDETGMNTLTEENKEEIPFEDYKDESIASKIFLHLLNDEFLYQNYILPIINKLTIEGINTEIDWDDVITNGLLYYNLKTNQMINLTPIQTDTIKMKLKKFCKDVICNISECEGGMASLGAAPTPNAGRISAATVNGIAVPSKSNKKKKKKVNEKLDNSDHTTCYGWELKKLNEELTTIEVTPQEMLEFIEDGFNLNETLVTMIQNNREIIKVVVSYNEEGSLNVKYEYLDIDQETVIDEVEENNLTQNKCLEQLQYLFKTHKPIHVYESINLKKEMNELKQLLS